MTEVGFYTFAPEKLAIMRQLVAKAYGQKLNVLIHTIDPALADNVDRMLWAIPPLSFLPHCRDSDALAAQTPILIGVNADSLAHADVLINLDDSYPAQFSRFDRVLEIVTADEDDRARGRERYKFYQERGYSIKTHDMRHAK
ncbi:MAG TPA: DNA polymerase III subunit chi [Thiobacillaceae bacterium]|nr:DNA polymerase III subunit chi [Thiobacillaceae bacterium]